MDKSNELERTISSSKQARGSNRIFSSSIEESFRLRGLALASLWVASIGLAWAGGDFRLALLAGGIGTLGYWDGWRWRHRKSLLRSLLIAALVIGLSLFMRGQMLEVFTGNWLPVGIYLIFVQAISSFESRTRGGLYGGLVLSGTVLFFASQQAFEPSFGLFVVAFIVVLLAFLTMTFLEDGIKGSRVHWAHHRPGRPGLLPYWIGIACAVFTLSGLAFWLMPRGELNLSGPAQLSVLPYSGESLSEEYQPPSFDPVSLVPAPSNEDKALPGEQEPSGNATDPTRAEPSRGTPEEVQPGWSVRGETMAPWRGEGLPSDASALDTEPENGQPNFADDSVFFVRSSVASYWRGRTLDHFDGESWSASSTSSSWVPSQTREGVWFNRANLNRKSRALYRQTFYIRQDNLDSIYTGYSVLRIGALDGSLDGASPGRGTSYRVLSSYPEHSPSLLQQDSTWVASRDLVATPLESKRFLFPLASSITQGAASDFEKVERIITYLRREGTFEAGWPQEPTGEAHLNQFLIEGKPGNAMDYATATVMLARAARMPARLAIGYLPGVHDPLSGAYKVRRSDAHVWAEVYFAESGWIPFDSSPRSGLHAGGTAASGAGFVLRAGVGDSVLESVKSAPTQLFSALRNLLGNPVFSVLLPVVLLSALILRWVYSRGTRRRGRSGQPWLYKSRLAGEDRKELLKVYRQLEKLLQRKTGLRRQPWHTVAAFSSLATPQNEPIQSQLQWFTKAVWHAAYNPGEIPAGLVAEARVRLRSITQALKASGQAPPARQA